MDCVATHRVRSIDTVQFEVQAACVANHLAAQITTPNRRRCRSTVGARQILLRALLVVVGALRAVVVVIRLRDLIRAGPQVIASDVVEVTGSCCQWRSAADLLTILQA